MDTIAETLAQLRASSNLRQIPQSQPSSLVDFSSNDYLGLASDTTLERQFLQSLASSHNNRLSMTSSASRLLAARQQEYSMLENRLQQLYHKPALLFNSGYHANVGILSALSTPGTLIVADKLVHASIIDGVRLAQAPMTRFRHNDLAHLQRILAKEAPSYKRVIIVAESVYSMDGDRVDISRLIEIKRATPNALLYIDEAHAIGVEGCQGLGLCAGSPLFNEVDIVVGTFGKALASMGAFALTNDELRSYFINRSRSFIFSTALPPANCLWSLTTLNAAVEMEQRREHLRQLATLLHCGLQQLLGDKAPALPSHIQPFIIGDAKRTVEVSNRLLNDGLKVLPIRTPTVPPGTERLRISLSAAMSADDITLLINSLARYI